MGLVIRRKITLEFLGDQYKDAYLEFQAIPVKDVVEIQAKMPGEDADKATAIPVMLEVLQKYFLKGKFPGADGNLEDVTKEDLGNLDVEAAIHCFQGLSGVDSNLENGSPSSSTPLTPKESPDPTPPANT